MDQLWAPWRLSYVEKNPLPKSGDTCFICGAQAETRDRDNLVVLRRPLSVVVLNKFPYNNGHLLVAPARHCGQLHELNPEELLDQQLTLRYMIAILDKTMNPDGHNVGLNLGRAAGAGLPGHLHWHIVPRWNGDTNFMPIFSDVKVISQSLEAAYDTLSAAIRETPLI